MDRPHWNEVLCALQEDVDFCEDGETTIARDGAIAIPGGFYITDDGQEAVEENEVPQILLQARPGFQHPGYQAVREDLNAAQKSRGFFGPRRRASGRDQGLRMKRSSIQQLKLRSASWFGWVQRYHPIHCCGAGCSTSTAGGDNENTPS